MFHTWRRSQCMPMLGLIRILSRKLTFPLRDLSLLEREVVAAPSVNVHRPQCNISLSASFSQLEGNNWLWWQEVRVSSVPSRDFHVKWLPQIWLYYLHITACNVTALPYVYFTDIPKCRYGSWQEQYKLSSSSPFQPLATPNTHLHRFLSTAFHSPAPWGQGF
jgi:hypothetical protein